MKILDWIKKKKLLFGLFVLIFGGVIYFLFFSSGSKPATTRYVMGSAASGSIISSVAASGSVTAESSVEIKPQASGKIISLKIKEGDDVKAGQLLAVVDNKDAVNSVKDAELNLQSAQLALSNIEKPADQLALTQSSDQYNQAQRDLETLLKPAEKVDLDKATNAVQDATRKLAQAKSDYEKAQLNVSQDLDKAYQEAYNAVYDSVTNMHNYTNDMIDVHYSDETTGRQDYLPAFSYELGKDSPIYLNYKDDLDAAMILLSKSNYQTLTRPSDPIQIKQQLTDAAALAQATYTALGSTRILIREFEGRGLQNLYFGDTIKKMSPIIDQDITTVSNYLDTLQNAQTGLDSALLGNPISLQAAQYAITSAEANLQDQQNALDKLKEGATPEEIATAREKIQEALLSYQKIQNPDNSFDIANQKIAITQKENALARARETLADYSVTAPFDGKISLLPVRLGDTISSGTSVATIISKEYLAEVDVNEVDVPKIKTGNKVTITLDAFPDDTLTGKVISLDAVGTSSQGVVNYTAKISFDNIMDGVKPGMTVSATIITNVKQDILLVPSGAVKTNSDSSNYVEYFQTMPSGYDETTSTLTTTEKPLTKDVTVGSSDDTNTEITSGLAEGDTVVVQTISATSKTSTSSSSALRIPGITGGGGGFARPGG
jgi:HlyD family secretion protein